MTAKQISTLKRIAIPTGIFAAVALVWWYFSRNGGFTVSSVTQPGTSASGLPTYQQGAGGAEAVQPGNSVVNNYGPISNVTPTSPFPQQGYFSGPAGTGANRLDYNTVPINTQKAIESILGGNIPGRAMETSQHAAAKKSGCGGGCGSCCDDCDESVAFAGNPKVKIDTNRYIRSSGVSESYDEYLQRMVDTQFRVN